jgi:hypothetical protein
MCVPTTRTRVQKSLPVAVSLFNVANLHCANSALRLLTSAANACSVNGCLTDPWWRRCSASQMTDVRAWVRTTCRRSSQRACGDVRGSSSIAVVRIDCPVKHRSPLGDYSLPNRKPARWQNGLSYANAGLRLSSRASLRPSSLGRPAGFLRLRRDGWLRRSETRPVRRSKSEPPAGPLFYAY